MTGTARRRLVAALSHVSEPRLDVFSRRILKVGHAVVGAEGREGFRRIDVSMDRLAGGLGGALGLWSGLDVRRSAVLSGRDTRLSSPVILIPDSDLVNRSSETGHEQAVSVRGGPQDPIHSPARATSASVTTSAEDPLGARWKALVCNVPDAKESGNGLCSDGRAESFRHIVRAWASDGRKRRHAEMSILRLESCGPSKPTTKVQRLESGPQPSPNLRPRVHCRR